MDKKQVVESLNAHGIGVTRETRTGNNDGYRIECANGALVNVFDSGKTSVQGKNAEEVKTALGLDLKPLTVREKSITAVANKPKVFVVYGHQVDARHELEAMLRRWELDPLILDSLPSEGATIIEKLFNYCQSNDVSFAVVLATPDDVGYPRDQDKARQPRARQNVVLELGMVLAKLGRAKVAILRPPRDQMEAPSDIDGLLYLEFTKSVSERKVELAREIEKAIPGFTVSAGRL
jgi:predicted nucleotide-binding protein